MDSIGFAYPAVVPRLPAPSTAVYLHHHCHQLPYCRGRLQFPGRIGVPRSPLAVSASVSVMTNSTPQRSGIYKVGDFMTKREDLHVVKTTTTIDEAMETLVHKRITGFPVIDDDWKLVGVVSDYDLLAVDSISGCGQADAILFPDVDSSWKTFNEMQRLLSKTHGDVVGDLMTPAPLVVRETTNLEDAVWLLIETKFHQLPVVDGEGRLVGTIARGNIVRAALNIKLSSQRMS